MKKIYLAGGLFNVAERMRNAILEKHLVARGHPVILPQREALKFFKGDRFDVPGIVADCMKSAINPDTIVVACADGTDIDGGTAVEYGMAIASTGSAIVYRTDFRTELEKEIGMNAMLTAEGTHFVYSPCFAVHEGEFDEYYANLARLISEKVSELS